MLENLTILLDDEKYVSKSTVANLPSNGGVMKLFANNTSENLPVSSSLKTNELCVFVWDNPDRKYEWYLGYVKGHVNDRYVVDHLHRVLKGPHSKWKYPSKEDIQVVEPEQIVDCVVEGEWDISPDSRKRMFSLSNTKVITSVFNNMLRESLF